MAVAHITRLHKLSHKPKLVKECAFPGAQATEMKSQNEYKMTENNKHQAVIHNIVQRGDTFRLQHSVSVSAFVSVDSDAFQKPRRHHIVNRYKANHFTKIIII
jgi:hypothetical protein